MTSLGQGSDEVNEVPVPVLVRRLPRAWRLGCQSDGTSHSQPRPSGQNKPGDMAQRLADGGEEVVAGLLG